MNKKKDGGAGNGGRANCILGVCCGSLEERQHALSLDLQRDLSMTESEANDYAHYMLTHYDLAPTGTLSPLYAEIAQLARQGHTKSA